MKKNVLLRVQKITKMRKISLLFISFIFLSLQGFAQYCTPGYPYSLKQKNISFNVPIQELAKVDQAALLKEDQERAEKGDLLRVGVLQEVNLTMENSGRWDILPNGDRLWRVGVKSEGALAVSFNFSKFEIPEGGEVYIYSPDFQQIIGMFDSRSVLPDGSFYTQDIVGDEMILEYYEPADVDFNGEIAISSVDHSYKGNALKGYHGSAIGDCHINTICEEGDDWRDQIKSVVFIKLSAGGYTYMCSGAMINNARQDNTPYVFTAEHCFESGATWKFFFNYETHECDGTTGVANRMAIGGSVVARDNGTVSSDFMLLKITGNLTDVIKNNLYFAGWDRSATLSPKGVGIHHPGGDYKKISIPRLVVNGSGGYNKFWGATWYTGAANKGVTEQGSSGSPLFNADKRIVGSLCCGSSSCVAGTPENTSGPSGYDYYGKLSHSWTNNNNSYSTKKLQPWLDPDNTGITMLDGKFYNQEVDINEYIEQIYSFNVVPNPSNGEVMIKGNFLAENAICSVYDLLGKRVYNSRVDISGDNTINFGNLNNGVYIVELNVEGKMYRTKMVIAK